MVEVTKETSCAKDLYHGHTTVGLIPVQLCDARVSYRGTLVFSSTNNTAVVFLGGANVSPSTGLPLFPGMSITLPTDDPSSVYLVSTADDQDVAYLGV